MTNENGGFPKEAAATLEGGLSPLQQIQTLSVA